jgi:hypothetical protein
MSPTLHIALERFRAEDRNGAELWQNEIDEQLEAGTLDAQALASEIHAACDRIIKEATNG